MSARISNIQRWINRGTYICPGCQFRMSGAAWSVSKAEYDCPRCRRRKVRDFKRAHK